MSYVCGICGKKYENVDDYVKCVMCCSDKVREAERAAAEKKRLEKLNEEIKAVKEARAVIDKFKKAHPDEYKLNFGSIQQPCENRSVNKCTNTTTAKNTETKTSSTNNKKVEETKPEIIEFSFEDNGDGSPESTWKINGKDAKREDVDKLIDDIFRSAIFFGLY